MRHSRSCRCREFYDRSVGYVRFANRRSEDKDSKVEHMQPGGCMCSLELNQFGFEQGFDGHKGVEDSG
jgi:hypothetical protein